MAARERKGLSEATYNIWGHVRRDPTPAAPEPLRVPHPPTVWAELTWETFRNHLLARARTPSHARLLGHLCEETEQAFPYLDSHGRMTEILSLCALAMMPTFTPPPSAPPMHEAYRRNVGLGP